MRKRKILWVWRALATAAHHERRGDFEAKRAAQSIVTVTAAGPSSSQPAPPEAPKFGDLFSGWPQRTSSAPVSQTNFHFPRRTASEEGSAAQTTAFRAAAARLSAAASAPTQQQTRC